MGSYHKAQIIDFILSKDCLSAINFKVIFVKLIDNLDKVYSKTHILQVTSDRIRVIYILNIILIYFFNLPSNICKGCFDNINQVGYHRYITVHRFSVVALLWEKVRKGWRKSYVVINILKNQLKAIDGRD